MLAGQAAAQGAARSGFDRPGNVLIADQFNNRVVEVDRSHNVVWSFGDGSNVAGPHSIVGVNDAERLGLGLTLMAGTGTPAGADPSCPSPSGCPDNRVLLVDQAGRIVWQYGKAGVAGSGRNRLNTPVFAVALPNADVMIADQANQRVIEVNLLHQVVWQYGVTGKTGTGDNLLNNPNSAELLANGHILIADENNNRVIEVNRDHHIVHTYTAGGTISGAAFASRLADGDTLITDSNNNRAVEVNAKDEIVWQYMLNTSGLCESPLPTRAVRLRNGDTLISTQFQDQVIEVDHSGAVVWSQGQPDTKPACNADGTGFNQLNAPYDAKAIGDFTGLTPPPGLDQLGQYAAAPTP
jgi:hypothetical protein